MINELKIMHRLCKQSLGYKSIIIFGTILTILALGITLFINLIPEQMYSVEYAFPAGETMFALMPMFFIQLFFSLGMSSMALTSPLKWKLQVKWPTKYGVIWLVSVYLLSALIRLVPLHRYPESEPYIGFSMVVLGVIALIFWLYTVTVFRSYAISVAFFVVCYFLGFGVGMNFGSIRLTAELASSMTYGKGCLISAAIFVIAIILGYVLSVKLYRKPVSKTVFKRYMKRA